MEVSISFFKLAVISAVLSCFASTELKHMKYSLLSLRETLSCLLKPLKLGIFLSFL